MAIALDTLAYARRLREAGFSEEQAEGQAQALAATMTDTLATKQDVGELGNRLSELEVRMNAGFATAKHDLTELETRMDARFAAVSHEMRKLEIRVDARFEHLERHLDTRLAEQEKRIEIRFEEHSARFDGRLADLERRITIRLGGMMVAGIGAVSALVKLL